MTRAQEQTVAVRAAVLKARAWQVTVSVGLIVLCFVQSPGLLSADTKLDLYVDPAGFLRRALSLWDPTAAAGQLQNQAYGYLFPMGPFFLAGHALGLPPWVTQRLWWCLVLLVAYHGAHLVLRRAGAGSPATRVVAALAYALAPRLLGTLGAVSVEVWPMAVAPWVLAPLLRVRPGAERAAAGRSALAVLCLGGVNAVASGAALVLPAVWLVSRRPGDLSRRLLLWWGLLTAAACAWWAAPLLLLGRYSPPFLDWIESAAVTSAPGSLSETLRGTTQWLAGIVGADGARWPAAFEVLTAPVMVVLGSLLALGGLVGLTQRRLPHRVFWMSGALVGVTLVTAGHVAALGAPWAPAVQSFLDGAGAPLRNVHKFEPVVRLPLVVGLAHLLAVVRPARVRGVAWSRHALALAAGACIVGLTAPAALVGVAQRGEFREVPSYWRSAASWLGAHPSAGRTLVLPGSAFASSRWGDPRDEPLQPLASQPWLVRDAVPLGSGAATRVLTAVEERIATGYGGYGLAETLAAMGVSRVLVRNDLAWRQVGAPAPLVVRQAVMSMPGARPVASFGPPVGGSGQSSVVLDDGVDQPLPAVEVFEFAAGGAVGRASLVPADGVTVLAGGPEALLSGAGGQGHPFVLASDASSRAVLRAAGTTSPSVVVTDTLQRREASFSAVRSARGPVLWPGEPFRAPRGAHDWLPPFVQEASTGDYTVAREVGGATSSASSSAAQPSGFRPRALTGTPSAAFDEDGGTAWSSSSATAVGQWVQARFDRPVRLPGSLRVVLDEADGADVAALVVRTDQGSRRTPVSSGAGDAAAAAHAVELAVPPGETSSLRVTVTEVRGSGPRPVLVKDVGAGVVPRDLVALATPSDTPLPPGGTLRLQATDDRRPVCVTGPDRVPRCLPDAGRAGEQDHRLTRSVAVASAGTFTMSGTVLPRAGAGVDGLLDLGRPVRATASSRLSSDAAVRPGAAVDGDSSTYWSAGADDPHPQLHVRWGRTRTVTGLTIDTSAAVAGSRPTRVRVALGGRTVDRDVDVDGSVRLPRTKARELRLTVLRSVPVRTVSLGRASVMPVVIGELRIGGVQDLVRRASSRETTGQACGFGPVLTVGGVRVPTRVDGTRGDLLAGRPLRWSSCRPVRLRQGEVVIDSLPSAQFSARSLTLAPRQHDAAGDGTRSDAPAVSSWGPTSRVLRVEASDQVRVLGVPENANVGWTAHIGRRALAPVTLDGWSQGWVVPAGAAGAVVLDFSPQRYYRLALLAGLVAAAAVLAAAAIPVRGSRRGGPAGPEVDLGGRPAGPLGRGALGLLAVLALGWLGLLTVALMLRRPRREVAEWLLAGAGLLAVAVCAVAPWPAVQQTNRSGVGEVVTALAVALAAALVLGPVRRRSAAGGRQRRSAAPEDAS